VANFLLAWWNAEECGGFDLTDLWAVDVAIAADMISVFALVVARHQYPDTLGHGKQFEAIVRAWRPALGS
jgi:predicted lipid carrier protein YhbT